MALPNLQDDAIGKANIPDRAHTAVRYFIPTNGAVEQDANH